MVACCCCLLIPGQALWGDAKAVALPTSEPERTGRILPSLLPSTPFEQADEPATVKPRTRKPHAVSAKQPRKATRKPRRSFRAASLLWLLRIPPRLCSPRASCAKVGATSVCLLASDGSAGGCRRRAGRRSLSEERSLSRSCGTTISLFTPRREQWRRASTR